MKKFIAALILATLTLIGGLSLTFHTEMGKSFVLSRVAKRLEESTGFRLTTESFSASLPFQLEFQGLFLEKEGVAIMRAKKGTLSFRLSDLFYKKITLRRLSLEEGFISDKVFADVKSGKGLPPITLRDVELKNFYIGAIESPIDFKGRASFDETTIRLTAEIALDGSVITTDVTGDLSRLNLNVKVSEPESGFFTRRFELKPHAPFTVAAELSGSPESWIRKSTLGAGGIIQGQASFEYPNLLATTDLRIDEDNLVTLSKVLVKHNDFRLNGDLLFDKDLAIKKGFVSLSADPFKAEMSLGGALDAMSFSGTLFTPQAGQVQLTAITQVAKDTIAADIHLDSNLYGGHLFLHTKQDADWLASLKTWPFGFAYKSDVLDCEGRGLWKMSKESFMVMLESCQGQFLDHAISLKEPIVFRDKELSPLVFQIEQGVVSIHVDDIEQFKTTTKGKNLPFSLCQKFLPPLPIEAEVSLNATLFGDPAKLQGDIQLEFEKIKVLDEMFSRLPYLRAKCRAVLKDNSIECLGHILGVGPDAVKLEASLPYLCQISPSILKAQGSSPFYARFTASGEIAPYLQLLYTDTTQIAGKTDIAIEVTGPIAAPHIVGKVSLYDASFESRELGTSFQNINAHLEGEGNQIVIKSLSGRSDGVNTLSGAGQITFSPHNHFPFDLTLSLKRAPFLQLDSAKIWTSGDVRVAGTLKGSTVTGQLLVDQAEFTLPKQLPTGIDQVEVSYVNQNPNEEKPTSYSARGPNWPIALDVQLKSAGTTKILGKELTTTWKGDVQIKGEPGALRLFGDLFALDGQYKMNGQVFRIDQGNIHLNGFFSKNTTLNVIAYQDIDNIRAEILLKGALQNPSVTFQSDPPLAQQEVLSLLLFKKPLPDLSSYQGNQLKQTFSSLTAQNEGPNFLSKLREAIGIDRIDITQNETVDVNEVSVRLGKYFYPGFYLFYNQTMPSDSKKLAVEANLMKDLKLEAEFGDDRQGQIQLKWRHDY